jgi:SpoVK/Ycf46/Vps4 family AAA+-type ATPase
MIITYSEPLAELITRAKGYRSLRIDLPSLDERLAFIEFLETLRKGKTKKFGALEKGIDKTEFASITAGMPLINIESLYLAAGFNGKSITREQVKFAKSVSIAQLAQDLLEVSEPQITFSDVAGMKAAKEFLLRLVRQIRAAHAGVPQTILLQGVPGCGKTHLAQALAHELGWPLVQLRSIRGPYVGQSEQQLELVITIVEQLKPVVLLFDEIDQLIGQRGTGASGDSGTSERMLARIFNWLGSMEHRGKILFIGTSNRPDILDAALLDRFRVSIPVLNPTKKDLLELIPLTLNRFDRKFQTDIPLQELAEILAQFNPSGRSLQEIMIQGGLIADNDSKKVGSPIGKQHIVKACQDYLPIEDPLEMEFIALTSLSMCSANSFLPWMSLDGLRTGAEIPKGFLADGIVDAKTGRLNKGSLHQKLRDLAQARQYARAYR